MDSGNQGVPTTRPVAGIDLRGPGRESLVERERLGDRLRAVETPLVLLHAPAGYGKSVVLAQWARDDPRPFASVTLTAAHNDPAVLLASLIDAVEPIEPLPEIVVDTISSSQPNLDIAVPRLEAALRTRRTDSVLVLDELEHLHSEESLRLLEALVNGAGAGATVAMATRRTPQIHVTRLQAAHRLTVLETADLVMTPREARALLEKAGLRTGARELDTILSKTEGWPVALYLAALSRRSGPAQSLPDAGFGGEERNLVDYMREEFLAAAPPEDVEFLLRVALLDRLCGALCDAVVEGVGSGSRLAGLARQNMLLIPLDGRDEWFRLHSLFAEMLRGELRRRHSGEIATLNGRASGWWEATGDQPRAIHFAIEAGDIPRAGRLIWEAVPAFNTTGRYASVKAWIEQIGLEQASGDPHLSLTVAHGLLAEGDGAGAAYWAEVARPPIEVGGAGAPDLPAGLAMIDASLARGGSATMAAAAARATASLDGDSPWASMADLIAGLAAHFSGDVGGARERLSDSARRAAVWNVPLIQVLALAQLALLAMAEGDRPSARILASQARAQIDRSGLIARPSIALAVAVSAYVNAVEHRRREAADDLEVGRALLARLKDFGQWYEIETAAALAAAAVGIGNGGAAEHLVALARARFDDLPDAPTLEAWVLEIEASLGSLSDDALAELTPAELRVLTLLQSHLSYPQIAARLAVSPNTVKTQVRSVFGKLGVSSRYEAVELCRSLGFLPEDDRDASPTSSPRRGDSTPLRRR
ncbi:MAG: AAA family ATPase [Actinobacteria bacterium]|nr:AAA family ATPase [Actinomycetota bacterium]